VIYPLALIFLLAGIFLLLLYSQHRVSRLIQAAQVEAIAEQQLGEEEEEIVVHRYTDPIAVIGGGTGGLESPR
jgi:hypothetical protein